MVLFSNCVNMVIQQESRSLIFQNISFCFEVIFLELICLKWFGLLKKWKKARVRLLHLGLIEWKKEGHFCLSDRFWKSATLHWIIVFGFALRMWELLLYHKLHLKIQTTFQPNWPYITPYQNILKDWSLYTLAFLHFYIQLTSYEYFNSLTTMKNMLIFGHIEPLQARCLYLYNMNSTGLLIL